MSDLSLLLASGGDERLDLDPATGSNKYLCSPIPDEDLFCFSSCTASPISAEGYEVAGASLGRMRRGHGIEVDALDVEAERIAGRLDDALGLDGQARIVLTPSGTDAALLATILLAAECPQMPVTSIMVAPGDTGSGMPCAASGRYFSHRDPAGRPARYGSRLARIAADTIHISIRDTKGRARHPELIAAEFAAAACAAPGRPIIHLMAGSKTGLRAPWDLPSTEDVIVDACQGRLTPDRIRSFLERGWPVLLTGSKFYGGPPFSGAVLMPAGRWHPIIWERAMPTLQAYFGHGGACQPAVNIGTVLRWSAAIAEVERFHKTSRIGRIARLDALGGAIRRGLQHLSGIELIDDGNRDVDFPQTIFSFTVRDGTNPSLRLTAAALRPLYRALAAFGVLVGQPVEIASNIGALRVAIGARNLVEANIDERLDRLFAALVDLLTPTLLVAAE